MENQITPETTSFQTPTTQIENSEPIKIEAPKQNNFLVVLLSVLLIASVSIAGFFAYQTQKLVKELDEAKIPPLATLSPEPTSIPEPTNAAGSTPTTSPSPNTTKYMVPSTWVRYTTNDSLKLCLPPKWESKNIYGELFYNRDSSYQPTITIIQEIPYSGGSTSEAYFDYWKSEYPNISQLVTISDVNINGNNVKFVAPKDEAKSSPEGIAVMWYTNNKLWKAGLSNWNMINSSQSSFLNDFYTMISCSF